MEIRVVHFEAAGATQDIVSTADGGLGTCIGAVFYWTRARTDGSTLAHAGLGMGACDGTREWAGYSAGEDGSDPSRSFNQGSTSFCIVIGDTAGSGIEEQASFDSFITNGVRIAWDGGAPSNAWRVMAVLFSDGDGGQVEAGTTLGNSDNADISHQIVLTDMDKEPEFCLFQQQPNAFSSTASINAALSHGFGRGPTGSIEQGSYGLNGDHGRNPANRTGGIVTSNRAMKIGSFAAARPGFEITAWGLNGTPRGTITLTKRDASDPTSYGYFAVYTNGANEVKIDTPLLGVDTTGNTDYTGASFQPATMVMLFGDLLTIDTNDSGPQAVAQGVAGIDEDEDSEGSYSCYMEESDPNNDNSLFDSQIANVRKNDATVSAAWISTFTSFLSNGFRLDVTTATTEGTTRPTAVLLIGPPTADPIAPITATLVGNSDVSSANILGRGLIETTLVGNAVVSEANIIGFAAIAATMSGAAAVSSADITGHVPASATLVANSAVSSANILGRGLIEATLVAAADVSSADLRAVGFIEATLAGAAAVSQATLKAGGRLAATLLGAAAISGADLRAQGFIEATLVGNADVSAADLRATGFIEATLVANAAVSDADLRAMGFIEATLVANADISQAQLLDINAGVAAIFATLVGNADVSEAALKAVGFLDATLVGDAVLSAANILGRSPIEATLVGNADISSANLRAMGFIEATLAGAAAVSAADLRAMGFIEATLVGNADISQATLVDIGSGPAPSPITATLVGNAVVASANILGRGVIEATFGGSAAIAAADLVGVGLIEATLVGNAVVSEAALKAMGFMAATVSGAASVSSADITGVGLIEATLVGNGGPSRVNIHGTGVIETTLVGNAVISEASMRATGHMGALLQGFAIISQANLLDLNSTGFSGGKSHHWVQVFDSTFTKIRARIRRNTDDGQSVATDAHSVTIRKLK